METPITKIIKLQDDLTYEESTKPLGKGALGKVFRGTFRNNPVAVKRVQLVDLDSATYQREETAMGKMNHDNVLKLLHVVQDSYFKYLVLELCLGTVRDYINGTYAEAMPSELDALKQMASGLHYIHSQGFVHRDIKPANVLISPAIVLKISDFGVSRPVTNSGSFSTTSGPQGTKIYFAPEFLMLEESTQEERANIRANVSIDYFSLGCLFFSYLTKGGHPFAEPKAKNQFFIVSNIVEGKKFMDKYELSRNYYEIIDGMTQIVSSDRWNLDKVIAYLNSIAL